MASRTASLAALVPATLAKTLSFSLPSGIEANTCGSASAGTYSQGPFIDFETYQRPDRRI
jgi:hypothetical protein